MLGLLTGCSSNNNDVNSNDNINNEVVEVENIVEEPKVYTQFTALGKIYESSKDINILNDGDLIYHDYGDIPYVEGEYKEVDFGLNLLTEYLAKNSDVPTSIYSEDGRDNVYSERTIFMSSKNLTEKDVQKILKQNAVNQQYRETAEAVCGICG